MEIPHLGPQIPGCQKIIWHVLYRKHQPHWNQESAIDLVEGGYASWCQDRHTLQVSDIRAMHLVNE